jgi:Spy/CpxP family protein refolding chaperone
MTYNPFQKKFFGTAALLLAGALAAGAALAQSRPGPGHERFARGIRAAMAILDLTDAQKTKVKEIFESQRTEGMAFHAQVEADRAALKAAAMAANPDPAAVGAAFLKVRADGQAAAAKMKAVRTQIEAVLTPEQKAKLDGWIAAHRQQRGMSRRGGPWTN